MSRVIWALVGLPAALTACSTDTQLGLEVVIDSATVTVTPADAVEVRADVTYRSGTYSQTSSAFRPDSLQLYSNGDLVLDARPVTPIGFQPGVTPGQSRQTILTAASSMVTTPRTLCGAPIDILLVWQDLTTSRLGMSMAGASVACP